MSTRSVDQIKHGVEGVNRRHRGKSSESQEPVRPPASLYETDETEDAKGCISDTAISQFLKARSTVVPDRITYTPVFEEIP